MVIQEALQPNLSTPLTANVPRGRVSHDRTVSNRSGDLAARWFADALSFCRGNTDFESKLGAISDTFEL
jgi:hypothetical protein